jgi:hypothetical protein
VPGGSPPSSISLVFGTYAFAQLTLGRVRQRRIATTTWDSTPVENGSPARPAA